MFLRFKSLFNKFKGKFNLISKVAVAVVATCSILAGLLMFGAKAPTLHKAWLRNYVGNEVVMIVKVDDGGHIIGGGTGFHVQTPSGVNYILTNGHVCDAFDNGMVQVKMSDGDDRIMPRKIIEVSPKTDLCLVEGVPGHRGLKVADKASIGDTLAVIGHPMLEPLIISIGDVIAKSLVEFPFAIIVAEEDVQPGQKLPRGYMTQEQCLSKPKFKMGQVDTFLGRMPACILSLQAYRTSIVGFPGNSGSPAVNFWGKVEGVLYAGDGNTNFSQLITLDDVKAFLAPY